MEKIPISFAILMPILSSTVAFLLHLQYYQRMNLKMWAKSKFFCGSHVIITDWKILKYSFFENVLLLSISRNSLQAPTSSLHNILFGNFALPNSIILVKDLIRWMRGFEVFLIDHYAGDIGNNSIIGKY